MSRFLVCAFVVLGVAVWLAPSWVSAPARAQDATLGTQLDAALSNITRNATGLTNQIVADQGQIGQLRAQVAALTIERDALVADKAKLQQQLAAAIAVHPDVPPKP